MANQYELIRIPNEARSQLTTPLYGSPAAPLLPARVSSDLQWRQFLRVVRKHWRFSLFFFLVSLAALVAVTLLMEDIFEATARLEIAPPPGPATVTLREISSPGMSEQDYFQTQVEILKSDDLALAVIQNLKLGQHTDFVGQPKQHSWKTTLLRTLRLNRILGSPSRSPLEIALTAFRDRLSLAQVKNSRLVEVRFASRDPQLAARVADALVNLYLERNHRARYEATMKAAQSLSGELEELRAAVKRANQAVADFQNANNIMEFTEGDGSQATTASVRQTPITQKVAELNRQLTQAQTERISQEAFLKLIQAGSADSLPQMRDNLVLQNLTNRYVESRAQLAQAMAVFGPNNPNARKLQNHVDELGAQLAVERRRIIEQVKTSYQAALTRERLLTQTLIQLKDSLDRMNEKMLRYNLLRKEAQANSDLYIAVSSRLKEAALSGSLNANNIRVVDPVRFPDRPARPKRLLILSLGAIFSILGGVALAFLRQSWDDTVCSHEDVKAWTGLPSLALMPLIPSSNADRLRMARRSPKLLGDGRKSVRDASELRFFLERPHSAEAEAVRSLVTSIRMPTRPGGNPVRVILLASPFQNEGKTTVAVNLATALAQHGKTCLIDADLRNPMVARIFGLSFQRGLQDVLASSVTLKEVLRTAPNMPNLTILPASPITSNPGELIASTQMSEVLRGIREGFDYAVIDSPPIIPYADGRWLSSLVDGVVIVARSGSTTRQAMVLSTEMLADVQAPVLGVVLNGVNLEEEYYGYGQYRYTEDSKHA